MCGDGVHVHAASDDGDGIIRSERGSDIDVLDVVHGIQIGRRVRVPRECERARAGDVIAEIDVAGVEIGDDEIKVVDELDACRRISRRIRVSHRDAQRQRAPRSVQREETRLTVTGG